MIQLDQRAWLRQAPPPGIGSASVPVFDLGQSSVRLAPSSRILAFLVSGVAQGLSVGVASSGWDGFGHAVGGNPDLPLVAHRIPGRFDQSVVVMAQQDEI